MRRNHLLAVAAVSILALAGCNSKQASTDSTPAAEASPSASSASTVETTKATDATPGNSGFSGLQAVVSSTKTDVKAGNFTKAKEDFSKFEDNWKPVEDGVKAKASKAYGEIEESSDKIKAELNTSKPNKEKVLTQLQTLNKNVTAVAK